jgi:DNA-directed RNA polymerase subunit RPC12/RpoP
MDVSFNCENCGQELVADASGAGSSIECPSCGEYITVPEPDSTNVLTHNQGSSIAKEEKHFKVPVHDKPTESLIEKPLTPLEVAAKETDRRLRIKTIRHTDCIEVGKDHFDERVSEFMDKVGEHNIVSIHPMTYTHMDIATRQLMTDYAVMVVYRG